MPDVSHDTRDLRRGADYGDDGVRDAVRAGAGWAAAGLVFLLTAAVWVSTCTGSTADAIACGAPQRAALALGAPAILLAGGVWSLARTYRIPRDLTAWWAWLATGSLLLALMVLSAVVSVPSL
ncbi:MAG: hypothetical protein U1D00_11190 [Mycobacterium sp.]|nr:hypothetical protein [Mycobacterium sp.]